MLIASNANPTKPLRAQRKNLCELRVFVENFFYRISYLI